MRAMIRWTALGVFCGLGMGCGGSAPAPAATAPAPAPKIAAVEPPEVLPTPKVVRIEVPPAPAQKADKAEIPALAFPDDDAASASKGPELPRR